MNEKNKKRFLFLFPTEEIRKFLCNDFFVEFSKSFPSHKCISSYNNIKKVREANYLFVRQKLIEILEQNEFYKNKIIKLYGYDEYDDVLDELIIAYVFYISQLDETFTGIDIFENKKSICYHKI